MSIKGTLPYIENDSTELDLISNCFESTLLSKNSFVNFKNPFEYSNLSIGLGQKQLIYEDPIYNQSLSSIYGSNIIINVPNFNYPCFIGQVVLECTLSCTGDNTNHQPRLASRLFSSVVIETLNGLRIDRDIRPNYTNCRLDSLPTTSSQIETSTDPTVIFNNNSVTCYLPCFFSFSEESSKFLINSTEDLKLKLTVNDSFASMGLVTDLTDIRIRAIFTIFKTITPVINRAVLITDVYYEPSLLIHTGDTTAYIPITCDYPVIMMSITMIDSNQELLRPDSFILYSSGKIINSINQTYNYSLLDGVTENNGIGSFNFWFVLNKGNESRNSLNYVLPLRNLVDKSLTLTFPSAPHNFRIHVLFEYVNERILNEKDEKLYYERYLQY